MADVVGKDLPAGAGPDSFSVLPALKHLSMSRSRNLAPDHPMSDCGFAV